MSKTAILVVKEPKNHGSVPASYWAEELGAWVDNVYGPGLKKEVYVMNKGTYTLGIKGMEKIIQKYGKDIIVAFEWVSRMTNKIEEFPYFDKLVDEGVEFCFSYDKFVWNKDTETTIRHDIEYVQKRSKEKSDLSKKYSKPRQKKEPADESPISKS